MVHEYESGLRKEIKAPPKIYGIDFKGLDNEIMGLDHYRNNSWQSL